MTNTDTTNCETLTAIAREHLDIETLQTRNRDQLDFHDVSVWSLTAALQQAYEAGQASANPVSVTHAPIATLSLDHLAEAGFETRLITPAELRSLAADLADHYRAEHFWADLDHFADAKNLPRI